MSSVVLQRGWFADAQDSRHQAAKRAVLEGGRFTDAKE